LFEGALRVREGDPNVRAHLVRAFTDIFALYGNNDFEVTVTANVIVQGSAHRRFSVFFGQDYGDRDFSMSQEPVIVSNLGDVRRIPVDFQASDFEEIFFAQFPDTETSVHSMICQIFLIRKYLASFADQSTAPKGLVQTLF
jgi:hypothetical protein